MKCLVILDGLDDVAVALEKIVLWRLCSAGRAN